MAENEYYETIDKLEKMGVDKRYIQGWASGFMVIDLLAALGF